MSVPKFHTLPIASVRKETSECVSVALSVPDALRATFAFVPGQYLTFRTTINGEEVRRSYSICSAPNDGELRVAIKQVEHGKFSTFANNSLHAGDSIDVMPPMGNFTPRKADGTTRKNYLAFAAGSGITPIMSIMKSVLSSSPNHTFTLVYGNKTRHSIIFREAIEGLKNEYVERLRLIHIISREYMDVPLFNGRINAEKCNALCQTLIDLPSIDEAFICGPEDMLLAVRQQLVNNGMPTANIHIELFTSPDGHKAKQKTAQATSDSNTGPVSDVTITLDGTTFNMKVPFEGENILDAALRHGADLPYACKGGVCCTCRAKLVEGDVEMEVNYGLEHDEIHKGFILTCQSHPRTEKVIIDFDER